MKIFQYPVVIYACSFQVHQLINAFTPPPLLQKACCRGSEHLIPDNHRCVCQSLFQPTIEFALYQVSNRSKLFNHSLLDSALTAVIFHDTNEQQRNGRQQTDVADELYLNAPENISVIIHSIKHGRILNVQSCSCSANFSSHRDVSELKFALH